MTATTPASPAKSPPKVTSKPRTITLNGWDTANVTTAAVMNAAIANQGKTPKGFTYPDPPESITVNKWKPWQITPGGSGQLIHLLCEIESGTGTDADGVDHDLSGAKVVVEIRAQKLEDAMARFQDPDSKPDTTTPGSKIVAVTTGSGPTPAAAVKQILPHPLFHKFKDIFNDWFNDNLPDFDNVFHVAMLDQIADQDSFQWLKPTDVSYAVKDTLDGTSTVFAALAQTDGDGLAKLNQDIDPGILANLPDGTNSALVISGQKFVEHVLLPGAVKMLKNTQASDFELSSDGLSVSNKNPVAWMDMQLDDGTVVTPTIDAGGFVLSVDQNSLLCKFEGVTWKHPMMVGKDIFSLTLHQRLYLELGFNAKGELVIAPTNKDPFVPNDKEIPKIAHAHVSVTPDADARDFQREMALVSMVLSILPFGLGAFKAGAWIIKGGSALASRISAAVSSGSAVIDAAADASEIASLTDAAVTGSDNLAAAAALEANAPVAAGLSTFLLRPAIFLGIAASLFGAAAGVMGLEKLGDLNIETAPGANLFVQNVLGTSHWPGTLAKAGQGWTLLSAELAESLILYGYLDTGGQT